MFYFAASPEVVCSEESPTVTLRAGIMVRQFDNDSYAFPGSGREVIPIVVIGPLGSDSFYSTTDLKEPRKGMHGQEVRGW